MKKNILFVLLLLTGFALQAQTINYHRYKNEKHIYAGANDRLVNLFPDSLRVELPDHNVLLVIEGRRFSSVSTAIDELPRLLTEWQRLIESTHVQTPSCKSHEVNFSSDHNGFTKISIAEKQDPVISMIVQKDQVLQSLTPGWEIFYRTDTYKLYAYTDKIENLGKVTSAEMNPVKLKLNDSKTYFSGRKSLKSRFIVKDSNVAYHDIKHHQPLDLISLSASAGLGVISNKVYPELIGTLGFHIADRKNLQKHRIELSYSSLYFANFISESGFQNNISSFATLSYSMNFGKSAANPSWFGIGGGLLVNQGGDFDFFKGKTAKFFLITNPGHSNFSVIPEFYLTEDFKKVTYGLKVHYRF